MATPIYYALYLVFDKQGEALAADLFFQMFLVCFFFFYLRWIFVLLLDLLQPGRRECTANNAKILSCIFWGIFKRRQSCVIIFFCRVKTS